jgi:hypothetical protein
VETIVVGGFGQVARQRILPAMKVLAAEGLLTASHIVDVLPYSQVRATLNELLPLTPTYHQIAPMKGELKRLLKDRELRSRPVVVATPTAWHAEHLCAALEASCPVALEKPLAPSMQALDEIGACLGRYDCRLLFPLGYYLLEKGLPLLALARSGSLTPVQLGCLSGPTIEEWKSAREQLGSVISVTGVLREGPDQRAWVLEGEAGGHTLETFSHLIAVTLPWVDKLKLDRAVLGSSHVVMGGQTETMMYAEFFGPRNERVLLACQKWCPRETLERWMRIECEHGNVLMDFDSQKLTVRVGEREIQSQTMANLLKYEPQLRMFAEKIFHPDLPTEFELARASVVLALEVRLAGLTDGLREVPSGWLDEQLRQVGSPP